MSICSWVGGFWAPKGSPGLQRAGSQTEGTGQELPVPLPSLGDRSARQRWQHGGMAGTEGSEEKKPGCETAGGEMLPELELYRCRLCEGGVFPPEGPGAFGGCTAPGEHLLASHVDLISQPADSFPLSKARGAACVKELRGRSRRVPLVYYFLFVFN